MFMGPRVVRRRPLLRAAAVGGTFAAGRAMGRRAEQRDAAQQMQDDQMSGMEAGHVPAHSTAEQTAQSQASAGPGMLDQLNQLASMHEQGALSDDEFAAAKAKILSSQ